MKFELEVVGGKCFHLLLTQGLRWVGRVPPFLSLGVSRFSRRCVCLGLSRVSLFETPWTITHQPASLHGIFHTRILEWVAISSCRGYFQPRDQTLLSCTGRWILYHWATWCRGKGGHSRLFWARLWLWEVLSLRLWVGYTTPFPVEEESKKGYISFLTLGQGWLGNSRTHAKAAVATTHFCLS